MFVQAYDKDAGQHYKSVVYAIIKRKEVPLLNIPEAFRQDEELAILYNPIINCFELLPQFDESLINVANIPTLDRKLNYIIIQPGQAGWNALTKAQIEQCTDDGIVSVAGYSDVIDQPAIIRRLLTDKRIGAQEAGICIRIPEDSDEWTYISTQKDANKVADFYNDFHDATVDQIHYEETDARSFKATVTLSAYNKKRCSFALKVLLH